MQCKGHITQITKDLMTGGILVTLSLKEISIQALQTLSALEELAVDLKKFTKKRSLSANAYYWQLVTKMAEVNKITNSAQHNLLLRDYGQIERFDGQLVQIMLPDTEKAENEALEKPEVHLKPTSGTMVNKKGEVFRSYIMLRGSSTYDSKEMSRLIDGTVMEAKQMGIETLPPEELERMKEELRRNEVKKRATG